ncbi:hypothetical protein ACUN90_02940 [Escherichia sp. SP-MK2]
MREIVPAARQRASDELASIQAVIDKQQGGFSAQPWDWAFYAVQNTPSFNTVFNSKYGLSCASSRSNFSRRTCSA